MEREPRLLTRSFEPSRDHCSFLLIESRHYFQVRDLFIREPSLSTLEITKQSGIPLDEIVTHYRSMQSDEKLQLAVNSIFYPRRIMFQIGRTMVQDFDLDRDYVEKLLSGEPVSSRVVEVHATKGTCNYNCVMCLWSDKNKYTYRSQNMESNGLMSFEDWRKTLIDLKKLGARTAVFSGGGEVLLNQDFFRLIELAHDIGLRTQLYTNGFSLRNLEEYEWGQTLAMDRIRFSIHSPFEDQYNQIVNIPSSVGALRTVTGNLQELLMRRRSAKSMVRVGIGFVIQPLNFGQIIDMVNFAKQQGVDFLNIRSDEVNVTGSLNPKEQDEVRKQLNIVRSRVVAGDYGSLAVDLSDNLTAFANEENYRIESPVDGCMSKYYRPAINPFGLLMPCDLKAEPRFYDPEFTIGDLHQRTVEDVLRESHRKFVPANCESCMPSGQTGNAVFTKIITDYRSGIDFSDSPFFIKS